MKRREFVAAAPEIPPLAQVGVPGFDTTAWQMLVAPGNTPRPVLEKLNVEVNAAVQTEEITKQFVTVGLVPIGKGSLDELDAFVKSEPRLGAAFFAPPDFLRRENEGRAVRSPAYARRCRPTQRPDPQNPVQVP